jgi:pyrimidine operon attenuation protein/uracil phosphoribosyltransferase
MVGSESETPARGAGDRDGSAVFRLVDPSSFPGQIHALTAKVEALLEGRDDADGFGRRPGNRRSFANSTGASSGESGDVPVPRERAGEGWAIVGIQRKGAVLARRVHSSLRPRYPGLEYGEVDNSLYRDDYHLRRESPPRDPANVLGTRLEFGIDGCSIVLIDDVLATGRTVRAAMHQILDFGRPKRIWLLVLVDRGHRELPIEPQYAVLKLSTRVEDRVIVSLRELGDPCDAIDVHCENVPRESEGAK